MPESKVVPAQDDEFVTISEENAEPEIKVVFEAINESFTFDRFLGFRTVPTDTGSFQQARFELDEKVYFMNANHSLREGLKGMPRNTRGRITWTSEQDTGQASPMRVYKVEAARTSPVSRAAIHRAST